MRKVLCPAIVATVIVLDQLSKYMVRSSMRPGERIPVIGDWMSIRYVQNTGAAFNLFSGNRLVTVFLTSVLIVFCLVFIIKEFREGHTLIPALFSFVLAGGISNMIDRLSRGFVTDMISCGSFAVFNIADMAITCGCALTLLVILFSHPDNAVSAGSGGGAK